MEELEGRDRASSFYPLNWFLQLGLRDSQNKAYWLSQLPAGLSLQEEALDPHTHCLLPCSSGCYRLLAGGPSRSSLQLCYIRKGERFALGSTTWVWRARMGWWFRVSGSYRGPFNKQQALV